MVDLPASCDAASLFTQIKEISQSVPVRFCTYTWARTLCLRLCLCLFLLLHISILLFRLPLCSYPSLSAPPCLSLSL